MVQVVQEYMVLTDVYFKVAGQYAFRVQYILYSIDLCVVCIHALVILNTLQKVKCKALSITSLAVSLP